VLKTIEIENIKGIQNKRFDLDILPNRPSLLVAPNGFGKSSIAVAFKSLNNRRIDLADEDCFEQDNSNAPRISIDYIKPDGNLSQLEANNATNTISGEIDCFVINSLIKPKGIGSQFGRASATLEIQDVVLVDNIPTNIPFSYSYQACKGIFGANARCLPNANNALASLKLIEQLSENYQALERSNGSTIKGRIDTIIQEINQQQGNAQTLVDWITANKLTQLKQINYLSTIGDLINEYDIGLNSETKSYLVAKIQVTNATF